MSNQTPSPTARSAYHHQALSRRDVLTTTGAAAGLAIAGIPILAFAGGDKLDPADGLAVGLSYTHESEDADRSCSQCQLYAGEAGAEWGPCPIFSDKLVKATGTCSSFTPKG